MENFTNEQLVVMSVIMLVLVVLMSSYFKKVENRMNKAKKKPAPKKELTLDALDKRISALEKKGKK